MEIMRGKKTSFIDTSTFASQLEGYASIHMDIGTGDGRFVRHLAQTNSRRFVIGLDACRENLQGATRRAPANTLFVIANAYALPLELTGIATHITINFPWGSLLEGLVSHDATLLANLARIAQAGTELEICLNAGALKEIDCSLEAGAIRVRNGLAKCGFIMQSPLELVAHDLKSYPTTWAKRLAFGRDPRAVYLRGRRTANRS
jgi:hypothetical protein